MNPDTRKRFDRLVVATGTASAERVAQAAEEDGALPSVLVGQHGCDKKRILQILSEVYRLPAADLSCEEMERSLLKEAKLAFWRRTVAVPMREEEGDVLVAMGDPENLQSADEVRALLARPVRIHVALADEILQYLEDWGRVTVGALVSELASEEEATARGAGGRADGPRLKVTSQSEAGSPAVRLIDDVVADAVQREATEAYLQPLADGVAHVRFQLPRKIVERKSYPLELHKHVVNRLRVLADLVGKDKRVPQSGGFLTLVDDAKHRVDVMIMPTDLGDAATLFFDRDDGEF